VPVASLSRQQLTTLLTTKDNQLRQVAHTAITFGDKCPLSVLLTTFSKLLLAAVQ